MKTINDKIEEIQLLKKELADLEIERDEYMKGVWNTDGLFRRHRKMNAIQLRITKIFNQKGVFKAMLRSIKSTRG